MNAVVKPQALEPEIMEMVLADGDLSKLSTEQRLAYYAKVCESQGLNPLTRPFDYVKLNGKLVLYAKRECTDQKRKLDGISIEIVDKRVEGDLFVVTARATNAQGRTDEDMGAVAVSGLRGEALANAMLKATTKAKRRVTLSICGMGLLDETEIESIQQLEREARPVQSTVMREAAKPQPQPKPLNRMSTAELDAATNRDEIPQLPPVDKVQAGVDTLLARIADCASEDELHAISGDHRVGVQRAWLALHKPDLDLAVAEALGVKSEQLVTGRLEAEGAAAA
jgi:hypothetical protein